MASKKDVETTIESLVLPITDALNFECVDVEYIREVGTWYMRVYIDKEGGITVEDCEKVSRALDVKLDEIDPIEDAYILEVSSPGLDRQLKKDKDFDRSIGKLVELKFYKVLNGEKEYSGNLISYTNEEVIIGNEKENITFNRKDIAMIRLAVIF
jgi:ribosome maturation factor RimP